MLDLTDRDGWMAGFLLAQLGAEVVLAEPPGGHERDTWFQVYNRGKKSVIAADDDAVRRLATDADVVIANGSPADVALLAELRADGVAEELLGRIDVPAGVPISSRTPAEIAVSILAKLIAVRREELAADDVRQRASVPRTPPAPRVSGSRSPTAVDPICGMTVAAVAGTLSLQREGETVYFCCEGCKETFEAQGEHASLGG